MSDFDAEKESERMEEVFDQCNISEDEAESMAQVLAVACDFVVTYSEVKLNAEGASADDTHQFHQGFIRSNSC